VVIVAMNAEIGTTMKADANNNCLMIFIGCPLGLSRDRRMRPGVERHRPRRRLESPGEVGEGRGLVRRHHIDGRVGHMAAPTR